MDWNAHIVSDPEVLVGKPVVRGTRLAVDFLLGLFAVGWTEAQVLENYPQLTPESLRAAGHDVIAVSDAMRRAPDQDVLAQASAERSGTPPPSQPRATRASR